MAFRDRIKKNLKKKVEKWVYKFFDTSVTVVAHDLDDCSVDFFGLLSNFDRHPKPSQPESQVHNIGNKCKFYSVK